MADVLNNFAITHLAQWILGLSPDDPAPEVMLFVNDEDVTCTTVIGDLTECALAGYSRKVLTPGNWIIADPVACVVECSYGFVEFDMTAGGVTIYGHAVLDGGVADNILWAQTWTTPFEVPAGGGIVKIFPFYPSEQC